MSGVQNPTVPPSPHAKKPGVKWITNGKDKFAHTDEGEFWLRRLGDKVHLYVDGSFHSTGSTTHLEAVAQRIYDESKQDRGIQNPTVTSSPHAKKQPKAEAIPELQKKPTKYGEEVRQNTLRLLEQIDSGYKGWKEAYPVLMDLCEENGIQLERDADFLMNRYARYEGGLEVMRACVKAGMVNWNDFPEQRKAVEFHHALGKVDLSKIPVIMANGRRADRKQVAANVRKLLSTLGIKGVSVTTPNYSMAHGVDVKIPHRIDKELLGSDGAGRDDPSRVADRQASEKIEKLLLRAFNNTEDRSDSMTDYFDSYWSIS